MRRIQTMLAAACVASMLALGACEDTESTKETIREGAAETGEALERGAEATGDALKKAAESTGEVLTDGIDAARRVDVDVDVTTQPATTTTAPVR